MNKIYLDQGATSFPKPDCVAKSMIEYIQNNGSNINRSVYSSAEQAQNVALETRIKLCELFSFQKPNHVIFTPGNTWGINMILAGFLKKGDHCIVSSMEHNAVMRPLTALEKQGVEFTRVWCDKKGRLNPEDVEKAIKGNTRLVVISHASNVCGTVQDAETIGLICKKHGVHFVLDGAQTAGHIPIDFQKFNLSALSVPAHKGLLGPQGLGVLLLDKDFAKKLTPIVSGGTGSVSNSEDIPSFMPDRFEPGTANIPGIYGLNSALSFIENTTLKSIEEHDKCLSKRFLTGIKDINNIELLGLDDTENRVGVFSLNFSGKDNAEVSYRLSNEFGIYTRCGLHCAPSAHKTLGTFPYGTVRFSLGWFNTEEDIDLALNAIKKISEE